MGTRRQCPLERGRLFARVDGAVTAFPAFRGHALDVSDPFGVGLQTEVEEEIVHRPVQCTPMRPEGRPRSLRVRSVSVFLSPSQCCRQESGVFRKYRMVDSNRLFPVYKVDCSSHAPPFQRWHLPSAWFKGKTKFDIYICDCNFGKCTFSDSRNYAWYFNRRKKSRRFAL